MKKLFMLAPLLVLPFMTAGCTTYHCKNFPQGSCQNMTEVYNETGNGYSDYRYGSDKKGKKTKGPVVKVASTYSGVNAIAPGDPVLTKPVSMRVWVAPWQDTEKDLNFSYVYIRVKDAEWSVLK